MSHFFHYYSIEKWASVYLGNGKLRVNIFRMYSLLNLIFRILYMWTYVVFWIKQNGDNFIWASLSLKKYAPGCLGNYVSAIKVLRI